MKPHWLITLSLTLMLAMACSKDEEAGSSLEQGRASIRVRGNVINQWGLIISSAYRGGFRRQPFVVNRGFGRDY